jgi:O-acetyl-ADP-ribose deacetylase (regulator of RNase III)
MLTFANLLIMARLTLIKGDITKLKVDAIVNAANSTLLGGGGVDGAIHRAAGPGLLAECKTLGGCPVGEAKVTSGYNLLCKFVIHTVGPVWHGGNNSEDNFLANCYINSLKIANNLKIKTMAFPNISTGVYGYPKERAAKVALGAFEDYKSENSLNEIFLVAFDEENYQIYNSLLSDQ